MMTKEQKDASNNREERVIELGKDGSLDWRRETGMSNPSKDWYAREGISGEVKGHRVVIMKLAKEYQHHENADMELRGYTYEGSIDDNVRLTDREARKLFQKYTGIASDEEIELLEEKARESVKQESAEFKKTQEHDQVVSELLNE